MGTVRLWICSKCQTRIDSPESIQLVPAGHPRWKSSECLRNWLAGPLSRVTDHWTTLLVLGSHCQRGELTSTSLSASSSHARLGTSQLCVICCHYEATVQSCSRTQLTDHCFSVISTWEPCIWPRNVSEQGDWQCSKPLGTPGTCTKSFRSRLNHWLKFLKKCQRTLTTY